MRRHFYVYHDALK